MPSPDQIDALVKLVDLCVEARRPGGLGVVDDFGFEQERRKLARAALTPSLEAAP